MSFHEIHESNAQFRNAWRAFAERSPSGEVLALPEVFIASSNITWAIMNTAFLPAPVETREALERAVAAAVRYFQPRGRGWMFAFSEDWLAPALRSRSRELLEVHGLKPALEVTGMVAERLTPPARPLPALDLHRVTDAQGRRQLADINARSYDMPLEVARAALDVEGFFEGEVMGFTGHVSGEATTCTAVLQVDGIAYVAMVATLAEHRRRSLAEVVIRHALDEARRAWGVERTVLHATLAGLPVYLRMGYRPVTRFCFFEGGSTTIKG